MAGHNRCTLVLIPIIGKSTAEGFYRTVNTAIKDGGPQSLVLIQRETNPFLAR